MDIDRKKRYIKNNILYSYFLKYGMYYQVFEHGILDDIIDNIDIEYNRDDNLNRFLSLTKYLIDYININTVNVFDEYCSYINILESNKELLKDYYFNTPYNTLELNKVINRLLISNFIDNTKYIDVIKVFLNNHGIELKSIYEYSDNECIRIFNLIKDATLCSDKYTGELFYNIDQFIHNNEDEIYLFYNDDFEYYKECIINNTEKYYIYIFNTYEKRKDYLKYFLK